jgi:hypothetical protein
MRCTECRSELPPGARFCIECAAPVAATGATERLTKDVPGKVIIFESDSVRIAKFIPDLPLGYLNGEPIYDYSYEVWSDPNFMASNDPQALI